MKRALWMFLLIGSLRAAQAQTASFNFSQGAQSVSGWTNVFGDPALGVRTGTAPSGITVSSISTSNWVPFSSGACAADGGGETTGPFFFPAGVMLNHWFQYGALAGYNALVPQLQIGGLSLDSVYTIKMTGSFSAAIPPFSLNPIRYVVTGAIVYGYAELDGDFNAANGAVFTNIAPDGSGNIKVYVNTSGESNVASICGLQVITGRTATLSPVVVVTHPANNTIIPEDGVTTLTATATETSGSIAKVEFYADTVKIGEATAPPYSFSWSSPDPGTYTLKARAIDGVGNTSTSTVTVQVESLNYFWSTTGNISTGGDTSFVGTVDSNRLAFRTKNIERMSILPTGNIGIGTLTPSAQFHTTGSVRLAGLTNDSTRNRVLVSDTSGNLAYRSLSNLGFTIGDGLGQTSGGALTIGDSIPGPGPHSFTSDRYQYLNGHIYSIGGSVNDPVVQPAFRVYNNGDITAGTTMDRSVNTQAQLGLRYYAKSGILQIGASDRVDTTQNPIVYGHWLNSGIILNSDDSNTIKGKFMNTVFAGDINKYDSGNRTENCFIASENSHFFSTMGSMIRTLIGGWGLQISSGVDASVITGQVHTISKPIESIALSGLGNVTQDSAASSLIGGAHNKFGGLGQFVAGEYLVNRTPNGAVLGNSNVDFTTLNYTGLQGTNVTGIAGYPLFALGNAAANDGSGHSNAVTVLYNGRTQINTTGHTSTLAQTDVTPKAALEVVSTNSGVLLPKLTNAQRNAIVSGDLQNGLLLYNTDSSVFQYYNGSAWTSVGSGGTGGSGRWQFASGVQYDTVDNIAIGTSDPQGYKLAVNGTAIFTKVRVKTAGTWPDYVFKKGFVLPGLAELERYVATYKHLPGIVSEGEVRKNGIDLGDHAAAVLQKVEELTLYLIDENKKLKEQNKQIEQQHKELEQERTRLEQQQQEIDELKKLIRKEK
jgi:hypothetical protein